MDDLFVVRLGPSLLDSTSTHQIGDEHPRDVLVESDLHKRVPGYAIPNDECDVTTQILEYLCEFDGDDAATGDGHALRQATQCVDGIGIEYPTTVEGYPPRSEGRGSRGDEGAFGGEGCYAAAPRRRR